MLPNIIFKDKEESLAPCKKNIRKWGVPQGCYTVLYVYLIMLVHSPLTVY